MKQDLAVDDIVPEFWNENMVVFRKRNFFAKLGAKSLCFMKTSLIHRLETALKQALERVFRNSNVNSLPKPSGFL